MSFLDTTLAMPPGWLEPAPLHASIITILPTAKTSARGGGFFRLTTVMFWPNMPRRTVKRVLEPTAITDWNELIGEIENAINRMRLTFRDGYEIRQEVG
jgi:hypothetical protein